MKNPLSALLLSLLFISCGSLGTANPAAILSHAEATASGNEVTIGVGPLLSSMVLVLDGSASLGIYDPKSGAPLVSNGKPMARDYQGTKVVLVSFDNDQTRRLELDTLDPVPIEWQAAVSNALRASTLQRLQSRGILTFATSTEDPSR